MPNSFLVCARQKWQIWYAFEIWKWLLRSKLLLFLCSSEDKIFEADIFSHSLDIHICLYADFFQDFLKSKIWFYIFFKNKISFLQKKKRKTRSLASACTKSLTGVLLLRSTVPIDRQGRLVAAAGYLRAGTVVVLVAWEIIVRKAGSKEWEETGWLREKWMGWA
jgi:hypothetical protein